MLDQASVQFIISALQHGVMTLASSAAIGVAGEKIVDVAVKEEIKGVYHKLKNKLLGLFKDKPELKVAIEQFEKKPEVWATPLKDALSEIDTISGEEVLALAKELDNKLAGAQINIGKYNISNQQGSIISSAIGDNAQVNIHSSKG
jgi:hypothetical protein